MHASLKNRLCFVLQLSYADATRHVWATKIYLFKSPRWLEYIPPGPRGERCLLTSQQTSKTPLGRLVRSVICSLGNLSSQQPTFFPPLYYWKEKTVSINWGEGLTHSLCSSHGASEAALPPQMKTWLATRSKHRCGKKRNQWVVCAI